MPRGPRLAHRPGRRSVHGLGAVTLILAVLAARTAAQTPAAAPPDLAARLSDAPAAMEYWDLTGQFRSGHRLFARFLITNEGPGSHTGAAVGHLILPTGAITPLKWGRTRDDWTISPDGLRLKIGKAVLDLSTAATVFDVDSDKQGIKIHVEFTRTGAPIAADPDPGTYRVEIVTPVPAHGTVWMRDMATPVPVDGTMALTHSWMERSEAEIVRQRSEVLAATEDGGLYFSDVAFVDGRRRSSLIVTRAGRVVYRVEDLPVAFTGAATGSGDARYPVADTWESRTADVQFVARLQREWLRWNPLDIIPAPFRWVLALKAQPQRVWADAAVALAVAAQPDRPALTARGTGVAVVTFQQPVKAPLTPTLSPQGSAGSGGHAASRELVPARDGRR